jgi:predicted molibdopterin-dependent oxidoreductase YjgC
MSAAILHVTIDESPVELPEGATVLDAVNRLGIPLPQLCKDPDRAPLGACRTCLVHVEGQRGLPAACHLPARDGMIVRTTHPEAVRVRRAVLDLTLSMLTPAAERDGFGQLGAAAARHDLARPAHAAHHRFEPDVSKSFFVLDREACILCGRCTVACGDVQRIGAISLVGRGHDARVGVFADGAMSSSVCTSCGQCVATCPTGALRPKETTAAWAVASRSGCGRTGAWPSWPTTVRPTSRAAGRSA